MAITWEVGQASALDSAVIARGREVGNVRVRDAQGRDVPPDLMFALAFRAFWPDSGRTGHGAWMLR